jgi:hypothetical protein
MSQRLVDPSILKINQVSQAVLCDLCRFIELGGVEEMVLSLQSQLTQLAKLTHPSQLNQEETHHGISALSKPYALGLLTAE